MIIYLESLTAIPIPHYRISEYPTREKAEEWCNEDDIEISGFINNYKIIDKDLWEMCFAHLPVDFMQELIISLRNNTFSAETHKNYSNWMPMISQQNDNENQFKPFKRNLNGC